MHRALDQKTPLGQAVSKLWECISLAADGPCQTELRDVVGENGVDQIEFCGGNCLLGLRLIHGRADTGLELEIRRAVRPAKSQA